MDKTGNASEEGAADGGEDTAPVRHDMVRWYNPRLLLRTGFRAATAAVFGLYADKREVLAALDPLDDKALAGQYDYSGDKELWLDYVADTGDGWDSTHAVARALAAKTLELGGEATPRGRVLIMGGDEVYPDPSRDAYQERLVGPFAAALPEDADDDDPPHLFAVPGNHDWYDGLNAFTGLFCRRRTGAAPRAGRAIGGWRTQQTRSYFALRLPQRWWLCGIDDQLNAYIDREQVDYFARIATRCMEPGDRVILCASTPAWALVKARGPKALKNLDYVAGVLGSGGAAIEAVIAGDLHHYSRYAGAAGGRVYLTAGGGGAFLHPTHMLPERVATTRADGNAETLSLKARFPGRARSRRLALRNLLLPFLNPDFAGAIGLLYALLAWMLESRIGPDGATLSARLAKAFDGHDLAAALQGLAATVGRSPEFAALVAVALIGLIGYCDGRKWWQRVAMGGLHWLLHLFALVAIFCLAVQANQAWFGLAPGAGWFVAVLLLEVVVAGGLAGAFIVGLYLLVTVNLFGVHFTNAFSSLRIPDWKNFLRLHIGSDGALTIYPVKIERVPRSRGLGIGPAPTAPALIEAPIEIK